MQSIYNQYTDEKNRFKPLRLNPTDDDKLIRKRHMKLSNYLETIIQYELEMKFVKTLSSSRDGKYCPELDQSTHRALLGKNKDILILKAIIVAQKLGYYAGIKSLAEKRDSWGLNESDNYDNYPTEDQCQRLLETKNEAIAYIDLPEGQITFNFEYKFQKFEHTIDVINYQRCISFVVNNKMRRKHPEYNSEECVL